jgi:uncharacterized membrane protein
MSDSPVRPAEPAGEIQRAFLPPPWLEAYERAAPGTAEKLVGAFVEEGDHRREMEAITVRSQIRARWIGQLSALAVILLFTGITVWGIATGRPVRGVVALLAPLAALVNTILLSWRRRAPPTGPPPEAP